jgi:putative ABC transport system ATP-binding protein
VIDRISEREDSMNVIVAENLTKEFGSGQNVAKVLNGINISVKEGQFVSIMGPSGCGKSTLLYLLGGLDKPSGGTILVKGQNIHQMKDKAISSLR